MVQTTAGSPGAINEDTMHSNIFARVLVMLSMISESVSVLVLSDAVRLYILDSYLSGLD